MRGLIDELATLITNDDPRWYAFSLNRPAIPKPPASPMASSPPPVPQE